MHDLVLCACLDVPLLQEEQKVEHTLQQLSLLQTQMGTLQDEAAQDAQRLQDAHERKVLWDREKEHMEAELQRQREERLRQRRLERVSDKIDKMRLEEIR